MAIIKDLKQILVTSNLTSEEMRAFESGLSLLTKQEQEMFTNIIQDDPELIYPLYINFKAKLRAARGTKQEWMDAVETEITQLEDYIAKRKVGDEIK
jgi:hypothetical protein